MTEPVQGGVADLAAAPDPDDRFRTPAHLDRRARAGRSVRDIGHALIGHQAEDTLVDEVADTLDALTNRLVAAAHAAARRARSNVATTGAPMPPRPSSPGSTTDR
jgi:hypothetical protein